MVFRLYQHATRIMAEAYQLVEVGIQLLSSNDWTLLFETFKQKALPLFKVSFQILVY